MDFSNAASIQFFAQCKYLKISREHCVIRRCVKCVLMTSTRRDVLNICCSFRNGFVNLDCLLGFSQVEDSVRRGSERDITRRRDATSQDDRAEYK